MKAFVYQAALLCEGCGNGRREDIKVHYPTKVPALDAFGFPLDESTFDSGDYPKGPYPYGGGEADCPQHCDECGVFLENPLTPDGDKYVREAVNDIPALAAMDKTDASWDEIARKADEIGHPHLAEWIRFYY